MIEYLKRTIRDESIIKLDKFTNGSWINVVNPTKDELSFLVKEFKLDDQNLISGLDENEMPRFDEFEGFTYLFTKCIGKNEPIINTFLIILGDNFLLTLSFKEPYFIDSIKSGLTKFVTTQRTKCLIELLSLINKGFEYWTINLTKSVKAQKKIHSKLKDKDIKSLLDYEELLNGLVSTHYYMKLLYDKLLRKVSFFKEDKTLLEELLVDLAQTFNLGRSSLRQYRILGVIMIYYYQTSLTGL